MKIVLIFAFLALILFERSFSQIKPCSTYEANVKAETENPEALKAKKELDTFIRSNNYKTEDIYIIPVVFHVMHYYGTENISKAQIQDAIRVLNEDFRKLNPDTIDILPSFQGIAADSRIEFRLANIDPDGNCTDGIVRYATTSTYNADESTKYESPAWPRNKYLNIWTAFSLSSGAAGYSYYPASVSGSWGEGVDGVMILYNYVGSIETSSFITSRTLTHEIGHYLNLMHTWGNSNEPGLPSNCDIDDEVSDTPNTIGHTGCNLSAATCGFLDNVQNYMEYSYCYKMFTEGQKQRMRTTLNSTISGRNNLWSSANLIATGTNDGYISQVCAPIPDFSVSKEYNCNSVQIQYNDLSWNTDTITARSWSFPGGNPVSSTDENPLVYYALPGHYDATLLVSNPSGSNQLTRTSVVNVQDATTGESIPWFEGFENSLFPSHPTDINKNWEIYGDGIDLWQRTEGISYTGQACLKIRNYLNEVGQTTTLLSPNIVLSVNHPSNTITFKVAYAQRTVDSNDKLYVFVSDNCGLTWSLRYFKLGATLSTNGGEYVSSFVPTLSQWREENISLSILHNRPNISVKFVTYAGDGNEIYIDDINLDQETSIDDDPSANNNLVVYPNPFNMDASILYMLNDPANVEISVVNLLGEEFGNYKQKNIPGIYSLQLSSFVDGLTQGIYFINLSLNNKVIAIKKVCKQ